MQSDAVEDRVASDGGALVAPDELDQRPCIRQAHLLRVCVGHVGDAYAAHLLDDHGAVPGGVGAPDLDVRVLPQAPGDGELPGRNPLDVGRREQEESFGRQAAPGTSGVHRATPCASLEFPRTESIASRLSREIPRYPGYEIISGRFSRRRAKRDPA